MTSRRPSQPERARRRVAAQALALSLAVHAAVLVSARHGRGAAEASTSAAAPASSADVWAGSSPVAAFERELVEVDVGASAEAAAGQAIGGAASVDAAKPTAAPAATTATPPTPAAAPARRAPPRAARPRPPSAPHANTPPRAAAPRAEDDEPSAEGAAPPRPSQRPAWQRGHAPAAASSAGDEGSDAPAPRGGPTAPPSRAGTASGAPGPSGSFGAEGVGGVRELARAFTRAIPPACDADPLWKGAPIGDAGRVELAIEVDERGHVERFEVLTPSPPRHLASLARRTLALLESGTFAIGPSGRAVSGRQHLEIAARTSDVGADEEEAARSFGLRYTWEAGRGTASFTQLGGRRVDVTVRLLRVTVASAPTP